MMQNLVNDPIDPLLERFREIGQTENPQAFLYPVGTQVRVRLRRSDDGQTPSRWDGAMATVIDHYFAGLLRDRWYKLRHSDGYHTCDFREEEIDRRYRRSMK